MKPIELDKISVRLTRSYEEIEASQRLRYQVFYEEYAATPNKEMASARLDIDDYDSYADHLIVIDESKTQQQIVGTYRLLRRQPAESYGQFYSSDEYDISKLLNSGLEMLELGRSCVLPGYRTRPIMNLLWQGIADYVSEHKIDTLFGCASLHGTDIPSIAAPLSYLHHFHPSPEAIRPRALKGRYINMDLIPKDDIDARQVFKALPPLIKGYLRVGATIGDGAVIDEQFNTTDVCIMMQTHQITQKYRKHFERKIQKTIHSGDNIESIADYSKDKKDN